DAAALVGDAPPGGGAGRMEEAARLGANVLVQVAVGRAQLAAGVVREVERPQPLEPGGRPPAGRPFVVVARLAAHERARVVGGAAAEDARPRLRAVLPVLSPAVR